MPETDLSPWATDDEIKFLETGARPEIRDQAETIAALILRIRRDQERVRKWERRFICEKCGAVTASVCLDCHGPVVEPEKLSAGFVLAQSRRIAELKAELEKWKGIAEGLGHGRH